MGDLLFSLVNVSRFLETNPEEVLRQAIARFIARFRYVEERMRQAGLPMDRTHREDMEHLWTEAKSQEKTGGLSPADLAP